MSNFDIEKTLNSDLMNISKDVLEVGIDSILEDGLLKDIPGLNILSSLAKVGLNIKDRLFIKKLLHFLYETQSIPLKERRKTIQAINDSDDFQTKVGEKLIFIIDKADEAIKAKILGQLFSLVLEEKLGYQMFLRCAESINKIFTTDLNWFLDKSHFEFNDRIERESLFNAGILKIVSADGATTMGSSSFELKYDISEVGLCLYKYLGKSRMKLESLTDRENNKNKW